MPIVTLPPEKMKPLEIPKHYWDAADWVQEHSLELQRQYPDKWIAVYQGEVIAASTDLGEVRDAAKEKTGERCIYVEFNEGKPRFYPHSTSLPRPS